MSWPSQVRYLELRSTPRKDSTTGSEPKTFQTHTRRLTRPSLGIGMTKRSYVETILNTIDTVTQEDPSMVTKLLLSIDRRHSLEDSLETVDLAISLRARGVLGIDVCGDPTTGSFENIRPAVMHAKAHNLKGNVQTDRSRMRS